VWKPEAVWITTGGFSKKLHNDGPLEFLRTLMLASNFLESLAFVEAVEEESLESEVSVQFGPFFSSKENRNEDLMLGDVGRGKECGKDRTAAEYG
jgi:hypothetical protein